MDKRFLNLVASALDVSEDDLKEDSTTETVPQWTSLSHWEVIDALENAYNLELTLDEATGFKNLGELYKILQKKLR